MISLEQVKEWFSDTNELYDADITYIGVGSKIEMSTIPDGYVVKIVAEDTKGYRNSYGDRTVDDGYIVFSVTDTAGESQNFKLSASYESYDGWDYDVANIIPVALQEKVITTWEWL